MKAINLKRNVMNIRLYEVLQYLCHDGDNRECAQNIQIVFKHSDAEWDDFEEINAASPLLDRFLSCEVICMGAEKSILYKDECVIRVEIDEDSQPEEECK